MPKPNLERYIFDVAAATVKNGGTASKPITGLFLPPMDSWSFPKYPDRTVILPPETDLVKEIRKFILENERHLNDPECWLGTWVNPRTKHIYLDIATSRDSLDEARKVALELGSLTGRRIVALYNSQKERTVYLLDEDEG